MRSLSKNWSKEKMNNQKDFKSSLLPNSMKTWQRSSMRDHIDQNLWYSVQPGMLLIHSWTLNLWEIDFGLLTITNLGMELLTLIGCILLFRSTSLISINLEIIMLSKLFWLFKFIDRLVISGKLIRKSSCLNSKELSSVFQLL